MKIAKSLALAFAILLSAPALAFASGGEGEKKFPVALIGAGVAIVGGLVAVFAARSGKKPD